MNNKPITTLVLPIAGAGTRLRPATYVIPKEMLRLVDKPIISYILSEAYLAGIRKVICITHTENSFTKDFFESGRAAPLLADFPGLTISFVETDERNGDGQAILLVEPYVAKDEPFAVTMGDLVPLPGQSILAELVNCFGKDGVPVISVEEIPREKTGQYGVIDPSSTEGRLSRVRGIVEKPAPEIAPSNFAMTGKYILTPDIFDELSALKAGGTVGELKLAQALDRVARGKTLNAYACETAHYDTGTKVDLFKAEIAFTKAHPELGAQAQKVIEQN